MLVDVGVQSRDMIGYLCWRQEARSQAVSGE
jgi:hypothetical protein